MNTKPFHESLRRLISLCEDQNVAMMCAEAVPWRCHRSLVADAMLVRGFTVLDIFSAAQVKPHKLTPFAEVNGLHITYPKPAKTSQPRLL